MTTIKSGDSAVQLSIDAKSLAARVGLYDPITGNPMTSFMRGLGVDLDTSANTDVHEVIALGLPGPGGFKVGGTATDPIRTDPTGTTPQPVTGTLAVSNFPTSQPVSGNVGADLRVGGSAVGAGNRVPVSVDNFPATQQVAGSVSLLNPVTSLAVNNFPSTQAVSGTLGADLRFAGMPVAANNPIPMVVTNDITVLDTDIGMSYMVAFEVAPTTVAAGTVYFAMRNAGAKTIFVRRFDIQQGFIGTAAASRSSFEFIRFTGTPSGGTATTAVKKASGSAASTATVLTAPAGLVVSAVTMDAAGFHRQSSPNQLAVSTTQDVTFGEAGASLLALAPNEGFAIRAAAAVLAGSYLSGSVGWHEK